MSHAASTAAHTNYASGPVDNVPGADKLPKAKVPKDSSSASSDSDIDTKEMHTSRNPNKSKKGSKDASFHAAGDEAHINFASGPVDNVPGKVGLPEAKLPKDHSSISSTSSDSDADFRPTLNNPSSKKEKKSKKVSKDASLHAAGDEAHINFASGPVDNVPGKMGLPEANLPRDHSSKSSTSSDSDADFRVTLNNPSSKKEKKSKKGSKDASLHAAGDEAHINFASGPVDNVPGKMGLPKAEVHSAGTKKNSQEDLAAWPAKTHDAVKDKDHSHHTASVGAHINYATGPVGYVPGNAQIPKATVPGDDDHSGEDITASLSEELEECEANGPEKLLAKGVKKSKKGSKKGETARLHAASVNAHVNYHSGPVGNVPGSLALPKA